MNQYVFIHGHFYQPPRENPWLEEIELQESAYPYRDWNERITAECYAPNVASRILDSKGNINDIINNYSKISFNFGPTLLSWLQRAHPDVYLTILKADKSSQQVFSGHGAAMAQGYNHMILPLANERDKRTQIIWGIRDFEFRFKRKPEGMWLPETAVDTKTLEILAEQGIKFTILAPGQAKAVRKIGDKHWQEVHAGSVNPQVPYLCRLPSGKEVAIFFYDGMVSHEVAFGNLLESGDAFAKRLLGTFPKQHAEARVAHIATDGETYGHHHRFGNMALAYCLHSFEVNAPVQLTVPAEFLEKFPPQHEAQIVESSSWSCSHGVERWRDNCGCCIGGHPGWQQKWRRPLRETMDWLRDQLIPVFEKEMSAFYPSPWQLRDNYIELILDRSPDKVDEVLGQETTVKLSIDDKIKILKLLEMQRHAMLMYTSCGWFFDDVSGIETVQILEYASRAMQLAKEAGGADLEGEFIRRLEAAVSNDAVSKNAAEIYQHKVRPTIPTIVSAFFPAANNASIL